MNKDLEAKANAVHGVKALCSQEPNAALIEGNQTAKTDYLHFLTNEQKMNVLIALTLFDFTSLTDFQKAAKAELAKYLVDKICATSTRYGRATNSPTFMAIFNHSESQFIYYKLSGIVPLAESIINKATQQLADDEDYGTATGITTAILTKATALKNTLNDALGKEKVAERAVETALDNLEILFKEIWKYDFKNLIDDAHTFNETNPEFLENLLKVTKINDLPTSHTGINGFGHDVDGLVINGGAIFNMEMPERPPMTFDIKGYYHDDTFQWGTYHYKFTHPDFLDLIQTVTIPRGRKVVLNVVMQRRP